MALPDTITFVTGNAGKIEELRALMDPLGVAVVQHKGGYPEIQHDELAGVTEAGAGYLAAMGVQPPFLLEDSGLFVAALKGFPGVYSKHALETIGMQGVLDLLRDVELESRSASLTRSPAQAAQQPKRAANGLGKAPRRPSGQRLGDSNDTERSSDGRPPRRPSTRTSLHFC